MTFSIFLPPITSQKDHVTPAPVMYWLSGLTCTDENFVQKAGAQRYAAELGIAIVCPDTSPRGENIPDDSEGAYDMGLGAGFYVDATQDPWVRNYQMYSYVVDELPSVINAEFAIDGSRVSIAGHSMGGHGALTIGLKNPDNFKAISAFSPICSPQNCPWGQKALGLYLGDDKVRWAEYDAVDLVLKNPTQLPVLIDQGENDNFLQEQLKTELLIEATKSTGYPMQIRMQPEYDHTYFFISSFIGDHIKFHAKHLAR
jgi:S-formylglutathione hydrolase